MSMPGTVPELYSTRMMEIQRDRLKKQYEEQLETNQFDEVVPRTNIKSKKIIAEGLKPIHLEKEDMPKRPKQIYKFNPEAHKQKVEDMKNIPEVEYIFDYKPEKLETKPFTVPADFGREYLTSQFIDLTYQLCRLTVPK